MEQIVTEPAARDFDSYGVRGVLPVPRRSEGLPRFPLASMLREITPEGAAALRCWPYGLEVGYGAESHGVECILPLTVPPALDTEGDWLEGALGSLRRNGRPLPGPTLKALAATLAPGPQRSDGLPGYVSCGPDVGGAEALAARGTVAAGHTGGAEDYTYDRGRMAFREVVEYERREVPLGVEGRFATFQVATFRKHTGSVAAGREGERVGAPIRRLLAAVAHDLLGASAHDIGTAVLGMHPAHDEHDEADARAWKPAARYWKEGRVMLAQLGCWPWAHAPQGKLPRRWRHEQAFLESLAEWRVTLLR